MKISTALTGFIVPKCKIYDNGFFAKKSLDPDNYDKRIRKLKELLFDKHIESLKREIEALQEAKYREKTVGDRIAVRNGSYFIAPRLETPLPSHLCISNEDTNTVNIQPRNPSEDYIVSYRDKFGIRRNLNDNILIGRMHLKTVESRYLIQPRFNVVNGILKIGKRVPFDWEKQQ